MRYGPVSYTHLDVYKRQPLDSRLDSTGGVTRICKSVAETKLGSTANEFASNAFATCHALRFAEVVTPTIPKTDPVPVE